MSDGSCTVSWSMKRKLLAIVLIPLGVFCVDVAFYFVTRWVMTRGLR